jgi:hypothetical protein
MALEYEIMKINQFSRMSMELALPLGRVNREANYLKFDVRHHRMWKLLPGKVNLIIDLQAGKILPLSSDKSSFVSDRFFLHSSYGYINLGHIEPSLRP